MTPDLTAAPLRPAAPTFHQLPDDRRMAVLAVLPPGTAFFYEGGGLTVTVARGGLESLLARLQDHGLVFYACHYFPLGTDKPAEPFRHDASYPGSRGFHLYATFTVAPE